MNVEVRFLNFRNANSFMCVDVGIYIPKYIYITPECGECGDVIHLTHVDRLSTNGTTADPIVQ